MLSSYKPLGVNHRNSVPSLKRPRRERCSERDGLLFTPERQPLNVYPSRLFPVKIHPCARSLAGIGYKWVSTVRSSLHDRRWLNSHRAICWARPPASPCGEARPRGQRAAGHFRAQPSALPAPAPLLSPFYFCWDVCWGEKEAGSLNSCLSRPRPSPWTCIRRWDCGLPSCQPILSNASYSWHFLIKYIFSLCINRQDIFHARTYKSDTF